MSPSHAHLSPEGDATSSAPPAGPQTLSNQVSNGLPQPFRRPAAARRCARACAVRAPRQSLRRAEERGPVRPAPGRAGRVLWGTPTPGWWGGRFSGLTPAEEAGQDEERVHGATGVRSLQCRASADSRRI